MSESVLNYWGATVEYPEIADKKDKILSRRRETTLPSLPAKASPTFELVIGAADEELVAVGIIKSERRETTVDPGFTRRADAASEQAIAMVSRLKLARKPVAMLSEDGLLTVQWQGDERGAALIFAGDGMVSVAVSNADRFYSEGMIEIKVTEELPPIFYENY